MTGTLGEDDAYGLVLRLKKPIEFRGVTSESLLLIDNLDATPGGQLQGRQVELEGRLAAIPRMGTRRLVLIVEDGALARQLSRGAARASS